MTTSAVYYMDLERVTKDLPILSRLSKPEKLHIIETYRNILSKRPLEKVQHLLELYKAKYESARKGKTIYHRVLEDQYRRIRNILEYSIRQRPLDTDQYY